MCRRDHRLPHPRDALGEHTTPTRDRAPTGRRRGGGAARARRARPRQAAAKARRDAARPVSRTAAGHGRHSRSARRAGAGRCPWIHARHRARAAPRARRRSAARPSYARRASGSPSSSPRTAKPGTERGERLEARLDERGAESGDLLGPRLDRVGRRQTELHAAQRRIALRRPPPGTPGAARPSRGSQTGEDTVEVGTSRGRPTLDDSESVRREDERGQLAAQTTRPTADARRSVSPPSPDRRASVTDSSSGTPARVPDRTIRAGVATEAHELSVLMRARREALCRDVERLEQVRLADAVRADDQHEARRRGRGRARRTTGSGEARRGRRARRARLYPARRIGMIR